MSCEGSQILILSFPRDVHHHHLSPTQFNPLVLPQTSNPNTSPIIMQDYLSLLPVAFGALSLILNFITYCIVRKLTYRRHRPSRLCCCAWTCVLSSLLLFGIGGFEIWWSLSSEAGGTWIGFLVVLSGLYWSVQAMKYHKMAKTQSAGYQPFNHNDSAPDSQPPRRRSNAPLIVEVDSNNPSIEPNISSSISPMSSAAKSRFSQPLIRNAVTSPLTMSNPEIMKISRYSTASSTE